MSILSSNRLDENQIFHSISNFLSKVQVICLLRTYGGDKAKGISIECLFAYILSKVFRASSFYMQQQDSKWQKRFSKNTYYHFLNNPHMNWLHFTKRLAIRIIQRFLISLTSENQKSCFVIDDFLYERAGYKRAELAARVFAHVSMRYKKGFRLLTLG